MNLFSLIKALVLKKGPVYAHYGITHRCNLRCRMCGIWKTAAREDELNPEQMDRMAGVLKELGVQAVSIGGGEPMIREDLPEAVASFARRGISVRVLTNGITADEKMLKKVADAGADGFSVSLDSTNPAIHDAITGKDGSHRRAVETIRLLSPILKKKGGIGIINTVFSAENSDHLKEIVGFAKQHGFYVSIVPLEPGKDGCGGGVKEAAPGRVVEVLRELEAMKKKGEPVFNSTWFLREAKKHLSGDKTPWGCRGGLLFLSIDPSGNFSICHHYGGFGDGKPVSILDDSFLENYRKHLSSGSFTEITKECSKCLRPCWAEINSIFCRLGPLLEMSAIHFNTKIRKFL